MSYILSRDAAIHYEEYGSGESLILLPGLFGTIETTWRRFIPEFARRYHTIAADLRGHGKTNNPSGRLRLLQLVDDLHTLLDTLGLDEVLICGYSLGGYIGLAYGLQHPGMVRALASHATKFAWTPAGAAALADGLDPDLIAIRSPERARAMQQDHAPGNGVEGWGDLARAGGEFLTTLPAEGITEAAMRRADFPVLLSRCSGDTMVPAEETAQVAGRLPRAAIASLSGGKHPMDTVPTAEFLAVVTQFFDSAPGERQ